ncbi:transcription factor bHLH140 [Carica papaya]|uniref:transcription factor bHLH140 n=1 Tax=Carica papaya TaxID=3649 RepID=UPI000B8C8B5A|nr:transcription factor bHLH140 [Carica papaya]
MDMDIDGNSETKVEKGKTIMLLLVGAPGSGKSTFADNIISSSSRTWIRICQDTINNGKAGTRPQCLKSAVSALNEGKNVLIDRCNLDKEQRAEFVKFGNSQVDVHAVVLDLPAQLCISRSVKRTGHEGNLQGGKAAAVVNRMLQKKEFPKLNEGFKRITFCQNDNDVQNALIMYSQLGPLDKLTEGCLGQRNRDSKVQLGIMKFLKKVDAPSGAGSNLNNIQEHVSHQTSEGKNCPFAGEDVSSACASSREAGKRSEDLVASSVDQNDPSNDVPTLAFPSISTHVIHVLGPNMNPHRPNCLNNDYIKGCKILREAYTSLFEGFVSIIRNQVKSPARRDETIGSEASTLLDLTENGPHQISWSDRKKKDTNHENERSKKWKGSQNEASADTIDPTTIIAPSNSGNSNGNGWGSWAQALYRIAMHPERHKDVVLEVSDDVLVLNDLYPKARKHLLVLARYEGLDRLTDVCREHLQLLMTMHDVGLKWANKFLHEDASLVFRLGYHSAPSMRQLHLHVISQDFDSKYLKNKKHWNSFSTAFFRDSVDVIEEVSKQGVVSLARDNSLLSMELRCHRCRSAHPNMQRLKSHVSNCRSPFPATLLENGHLVLTQSSGDSKL